MNKALTILVPLCFLLAACPSTPRSAAFIPNCPSAPGVDVCPSGLDERNKIKIHVTRKGVNTTPRVVCAARGTTITATLTKAESVPDGVLVTTVPKDGADGWVLSTGTVPGTLKIEVPETIGVDTYRDYFVMTSTGKCEDPMIYVDR